MVGETHSMVAKDVSKESSIIKAMQEIEPGFIPKDDQAIKIFSLQTQVHETESNIEAKVLEKEKVRTLLMKRFHKKLSKLTTHEIDALSVQQDRLLDEVIKHYESALENYPDNSIYDAHALFN